MKRLLLLTCLAALGCSAGTAQEPLASSVQTPTPKAAPMPMRVVPSITLEEVVPSKDAAPPQVPVVPRYVSVGGITAAVVPVPLVGGSLTPPDDPALLGWWGKRLGVQHGTTLLTGHTVHDGGGALDDLELVPLGTPLRASGLRYTVTGNRVISKARLAETATRLFSQTGPHRVVVVTCEDYDPVTGHYASNVVLTATPKR